MAIANLLKIRRKAKRKKPAFNRQEYKKKKALKTKWLRPRGKDSKLKKYEKPRGKRPSTGYSSPKAVRGLNPSGFHEKLVFRPVDLNGLDPKSDVAIIGSTVGKKKRGEIIKAADKLKLHVINK
ncbi:MAG: 50S ribosomal protein L32e [Candidatus Aenigmatarchaeota archaeon]